MKTKRNRMHMAGHDGSPLCAQPVRNARIGLRVSPVIDAVDCRKCYDKYHKGHECPECLQTNSHAWDCSRGYL